MNYRLYTFVAHHYLSPIQRGLQTAHVVSEMVVNISSRHDGTFMEWASKDKTIIICGAGNHQGVLDCWAELKRTGVDPGFVPGAIFFEDQQSMNGMATACGVIVPEEYWNTTFIPENHQPYGGFDVYRINPPMWEYVKEVDGARVSRTYPLASPEGQFIDHIKKYRLA